MFKKLLYTTLTVVALFSFAACGSSDSGKEPTEAPKATEAPKDDDKDDTKNQDKDLSSLFDELENRLNSETVVEVTPIAIPTEVPDDSDEDFDWDDEDADEDGSSSATAVTDGVIVDNEQCAFKIVSVDADNFWGYTLNVQLENKTNLNLSFSMDDVYVDGVYCDPYWYCDVEPGETVTDEVSFYTEDFEALGITEPTSITFLLTVYDDDNWEADNLVEDTYVFYPEGEENAVVYEYDFDADDTVLVENENITMAFLNYEYDEDWGYIVDVYMENHTNEYLMFAMDEVSVNGFMCDPYWAFSIPAGMKAHSSFHFSNEDLELNEISTVTDIEFFLSVYNYNDWEDYYVEETFTVYPLGEEAAQTYERTPKDSDIILFDNDSCTMIITGFTYDEIWGYSAIAYLENKTDAELYYSIENAKVNGVDCDPFWIEVLGPGKKCNSEINWSTYTLEDSGITTIETLDLPIIVNDYSDWENSEVINETFTVTP